MAQLDALLIAPIIGSLFIVLFLYYVFSIKLLIPSFFSMKKFRDKKMKDISFLNTVNKKVGSNLLYTIILKN